MTYDQAQSPRLGQRTPVESTYVRMFTGAEIPEAAWPGQIIYRVDGQFLQVYNGTAWEDVVAGAIGLLTFVGSSVPVSMSIGDIWFDSANGNKMYRAASVGADAIVVGEWVSVQDASIATAQTSANNAQTTANSKIKTFIQTSIPTSVSIGDIWYDSDDNNRQYRAAAAGATTIGVGAWVLVQSDPAVASVAPSTSSAIQMITGTTTSLVVQTEAVLPFGSAQEVHISTTTGFSPTHAGATMIADTAASVISIDHLPDGTLLDPTVTYYVRTWTHNPIGYASAASAEKSGVLNLSNIDTLMTSQVVAGFILAGAITIGQSSIDANTGWTINGPGGVPVLQFPVDGVSPLQLTALLVAQTLNVQEKFTLSGLGQVYGELLLAAGIQTPQTIPTYSYSWPKTASDYYDSTAGAAKTGAIEDPVTNTNYQRLKKPSTTWQIMKFIKTTAHSTGTAITLSGTNINSASLKAFTYVSGASKYYAIGIVQRSIFLTGNNEQRYLLMRFSTSGVLEAEVDLGDDNAFGGYKPALVSDGTNVGLLWIPSSKNIMLRWYNPTTLATVGSDVTLLSLTDRGSVGDGYYGNSDLGSARLFVTFYDAAGATTVFCFNPASSYAQDSTHNFLRSSSGPASGLFYDTVGSQFMSTDENENAWYYGTYPVDKVFQTKYSWYDGNATGSTHRSLPSPQVAHTLPARSYLSLTTDPAPDYFDTDGSHTDKANQVKLYVTDNGGSTWHVFILTGPPWGIFVPTVAGVSTETPTVTNEFLSITAATAGQIRTSTTDAGFDSITELIRLKADGTFRLGSYGSGRHYGSRQHSTTQTITNSTLTILSFDTVKDTHTGLSWNSGSKLFVVAKAGVYHTVLNVHFDNLNTTGRRNIQILLNGSQYAIEEKPGAAMGAGSPTLHLCVDVACAVGDTIGAQVFHTAGVNLNVGDSPADPLRHFFSCTFVGS